MRRIPSLLITCVPLLMSAAAIAAAPGAPSSPNATAQDAAFDPGNLFNQARTHLQAGDLMGARAFLTRALIERTDWGDAYALRAGVEAQLGNITTAKADLAHAQEYRAAASLVQDAQAALQRAPAAVPVALSWETLRKQALAGATFEKLVPLATDLVKAGNNARVRWDELYQSRLAALLRTVHDKPNDAAATLDLADFLYAESEPLGEPLSPKGGMRYYRFSDGTIKREIQHADALYSQVLKSDPQNVRALTGKAAMRLEHDDWDDGVAFAKKALATGKPTPELLELLSRILANDASSNAWTALDLRTPKTWLTFGIGVTVMWTREPSDAERQRSAQLDDIANELFSEADAQLQAAADARSGTADGAFYQGLRAERAKNNRDAGVHGTRPHAGCRRPAGSAHTAA